MKNKVKQNSFKNQPSEDGKFGVYGGMFVAETLMPLILEVSKSYNKLKNIDEDELIYKRMKKYESIGHYTSNE